jgi:hypothetical protein
MSASAVRRSNLKPVPRRKGKLISNQDLVAAKFEPWEPEENEEILPSTKMMNDITITSRLAHTVMLTTRDQLVTRSMDASNHNAVFELIECFKNTEERLKEMAGMVGGARLRVLASMAAACENLKVDHRKKSKSAAA